MKIQKGQKIIVEYITVAYNSYKNTKRIAGEFIGDYGNYILIIDKWKIRRTTNKQDIVKIIAV